MDSIINVNFEPRIDTTFIKLNKISVTLYNIYNSRIYHRENLYGECGPIMTEDKSMHLDVDCTFGAYADCNPHIQGRELLKKLLKKTKKNKTYILLISIYNADNKLKISVKDETSTKEFKELVDFFENNYWTIYPKGPINNTEIRYIFSVAGSGLHTRKGNFKPINRLFCKKHTQ